MSANFISEGRDRMKAVDFQSLVIGGLLVLVVLCVVGAVPWLGQDRFQRFTIVPMSDNRAFMLDTATGQAWDFTEPGPNTFLNINTTRDFFLPKTDAAALLSEPVTPNP
jgi:hypothetical protein